MNKPGATFTCTDSSSAANRCEGDDIAIEQAGAGEVGSCSRSNDAGDRALTQWAAVAASAVTNKKIGAVLTS